MYDHLDRHTVTTRLARKAVVTVLAGVTSLSMAGCASGHSGDGASAQPSSVSGSASPDEKGSQTPSTPAVDVAGIFKSLANEVISNPEILYTYYADYYARTTGQTYFMDGSSQGYPTIRGSAGAGTWRFWLSTPQDQWGQVMKYYMVEPGTPEQSIMVITVPDKIPEDSKYLAGGAWPTHLWFAIDRDTYKPYMLRVSVSAPTVVDGHVVYAEILGSDASGVRMEDFSYDVSAGRYTSEHSEVHDDNHTGNISQTKWMLPTGTIVTAKELLQQKPTTLTPLAEAAK